MGIVSISLDDESRSSLNEIQKEYGLACRSEAVRLAIRSAMAGMQESGKLKGTVEGVLIVVRREHADPWMSAIQARYVRAVKTQLHSHLRDERCLDVMIVSDDAEGLRSMLREIEGSGKADYVRFIPE